MSANVIHLLDLVMDFPAGHCQYCAERRLMAVYFIAGKPPLRAPLLKGLVSEAVLMKYWRDKMLASMMKLVRSIVVEVGRIAAMEKASNFKAEERRQDQA